MVFRLFIGPFAACFSVTLFILVLQFLARYQNDIFGKGLGGWLIAQLFFYASVQLVLMSLPISVMMAALMTFGKLGENYELAAIRSAGISLLATIRPLIMTGLLLTATAYYFAWVLIPRANLQLFSLLHDAQQAKPEFAVKPGFFNNMIDGYTLYANGREADGTLRGIHIYDHTDHRGNARILVADRARMYRDERTLYLHLVLYNGVRYLEQANEGQDGRAMIPFSRMLFDSLHYRLDLSGFGLKRTDKSLFMSHYYMMEYGELSRAIDSVWQMPREDRKNMQVYVGTQLDAPLRMADSLQRPTDPTQAAVAVTVANAPKSNETAPKPAQGQRWDPLSGLTTAQVNGTLSRAQVQARNLRNYLEITHLQLKNREEDARKFETEYHMRWAVPAAVLVFLFIGGPLGAIVRKGGIGFPVVASVGFFILFYVLSTNGKKLAREGVMPIPLAAWLPIYSTLPLAILLTWQSQTDSRLLELATYQRLLRVLNPRNWRKKRSA
jgi:lipopolysaccharide export system permease protein